MQKNILRTIGFAACLAGLLLTLISCSLLDEEVHSLILPSVQPLPTASSTVPTETFASENSSLSLPIQLNLYRKDTDDGFRIEYDSSETASTHVNQTWISPKIEGLSYGVHVLTSRISSAKQAAIQQDAVIVNPRTGQYHIYPLYHFTYQDEPDYDFAKGYGFKDERYFVYIAMRNDPDHAQAYRYEAVKMDILTGEKTVVSDQFDVGNDWYAHSWMNEDGDALYLNTDRHRKGMILRIDLNTGDSAVVAEGIKHTWPFFLTSIAPDGDRFWYTNYAARKFNLYQANGKLLSEVPFGDNYLIDRIYWSKKGQYAYQEYTSENGHIVERRNDPEFKEIAAERILVYDEDGKALEVITAGKKGRYVELAGWVSDDSGAEYVLIQSYSWQPNEDSEDPFGMLGRMKNSEFSLYDPRRDEYRTLKLVTDKTRLKHPHAAMNGRGYSIYAVDVKDGYIIEAAPQGYWVDSGNPDELVSVAYGAEHGDSHSVEVWNKQPEDGSSAYEAIDLRPYKATEGKLLSRSDMRYVTIK